MIVSIVVLPEPDGPTIATRSPAATSTLTPSSARTPPGIPLADRVELDRAHPWESLTCRPGWIPDAGDLDVAGCEQARA